MKKMKCNATTAGVALGALALVFSVYAGYKATRPQVGVINFGLVQQKAKVYKAAAEYQKKYDEQIQQIIMKDKDFVKLQEEGNQLVAQQKTMPREEFERKSQALQARAVKINEKYQDSFERNAMAAQLAMRSVEKEIAEAIEATSQKTGVKILLPVTTILYASEKADLSDEFVKELDKRVQDVNYPNPATLK